MRSNPALVIFLTFALGYYVGSIFNPAINLGVCAGARTNTASAAMVADVAKREVPMLGYTVPYAVDATLMPLLGILIVLIY